MFDYQAYYCEENILRLSGHQRLAPFRGRVIFISAQSGACPMWAMAAAVPGEPIFWDYHVVLAADSGHGGAWQIWDLDTTLGLPLNLTAWLQGSFRQLVPLYMPRFRVVEAALFQKEFSSDRGHMVDEDGWKAPPPSWPPIYNGRASNLARWIQVEAPWFGEVTDIHGLFGVLG